MKKTAIIRKILIPLLIAALTMNLGISAYADVSDNDIESAALNVSAPVAALNVAEPVDTPDVSATEVATPAADVTAPVSEPNPVESEETVKAPSITATVEYDDVNEKLVVTAEFFGPDGNAPQNIAYNYKVYFYTAGSSANKNTITSESNKITKTFSVSAKEYDVYAQLLDKDNTVLAESAHVSLTGIKPALLKSDIAVEASADDENTGVITVNSANIKRLKYRRDDNSVSGEVEGNTITGLAPGKYYVISPSYRDGNIIYIYNSQTVTVPGGAVIPQYYVKATGENVITAEVGNVRQGRDASIFVKPVDPDTYYIDKDDITVEPAGSFASYSYYADTGELTIKNVRGNLNVKAVATEKAVVSNLEVKKVSFNENGIYSEENPYISTTFEIVAKDQNGNALPAIDIYFRDEASDVSYTNIRTTDENGIAVFAYSYGINAADGEDKADYEPLFGTDVSFGTITVKTEIHLVLQFKKDLVLYTDQIKGTKRNEKNGEVINVPEGYEIWTGEVHQSALLIGSGKWEGAVDGKFTGLSIGEQAIRAGEKRFEDTNTFYFASDHEIFFVPDIDKQVKADPGAQEEKPKDKTDENPSSQPSTDETGNTDDTPSRDNEGTTDDTTSANIQNNPSNIRRTTLNNDAAADDTEPADDDNKTDEESSESETKAVAVTNEPESRVISDEAAPLASAPITSEIANAENAKWPWAVLILLILTGSAVYGTYRYVKVKKSKA